MSHRQYRSYPNAARALRQLGRHAEGPVRPLRRPSALELRLAEQAHAALGTVRQSAHPVAGQPHKGPAPESWSLVNEA